MCPIAAEIQYGRQRFRVQKQRQFSATATRTAALVSTWCKTIMLYEKLALHDDECPVGSKFGLVWYMPL